MYAMRNKTYLCSIIIVVFMDLFSGGDPPLELPLVVGGGCFFLELKGVVHDYTYKITSL